ncbi:MAG: bifunctional diaminohydroxyphosphoribosylaminopyrimidine deaminase/5-amino-6-(5-phosphoribosylamino)uracil reductase RibD [Candidatus Omnitrophica bacterium]|nr:bifunctional diaminohydroxyphosphoribosylaminopyrimidine deaminase/5-amino-6-(5-phosphoribosylamino)uracil reductase RibD [Candidatus Omnitrophota bacterium]MBU1128852.1 bifunctional diaminohydroxyphosphoribosylaminopyrimidine deaminase/5-amino-6-(5-phosphoribosylamino)uracil reductase RibD [Candidatus Omnitrophota bacterium]MBU1785155.1 bifunctional diaminohydroxyphosphoribosylaminopyrimidine deaminase/5-amino-6-(5-phosphoribosylamino)uracil reductase RibD [Candidatus Omnitrophota bacterium]
MDDHVKYMRTALLLAAKAEDRTYPNPMVGAVIVAGGKIIGRGYHRKAGCDHAEIAAIKSVSGPLAGAEMFVTLEPCAHYGKTPPCAQVIIKSGIRKVNVAMLDPNPLVSGRGVKALRACGISVNTGLLRSRAYRLNRKYLKYITTGLPYVTVKLAQSIDGKIAARDGSSKWITCASSRKYVKKLRACFDAICVGANTVRADDPSLLAGTKRGRGISRIVVDSALRIPLSSNLVKTARSAPLIIGTTEFASAKRVEKFRNVKGVEVIVTKSKGGKVSLRAFLKKLGQKGIVNILVEGGGEIAGSFADEALADEWIFFIAPKIIGGDHASVKGKGVRSVMDVIKLKDVRWEGSGDDLIVRGRECLRA